MKMMTFQINKTKAVPFKTMSVTLDEVTGELPQGFYTTFGTLEMGTKVLGLSQHLQRLYAPAKEMGINPSVDEPILRNRIAELAKINLPNESRIRLILTKNKGQIYIGIQPFIPLSKYIYEDGVKVITTHLARQAPRIKDTGFITASIKQRRQVNKEVFEILLTKNENILEGMTSNFYIITGNMLITAQRGILLGVTRRAVIRLAKGEGMFVEYRNPRVDEEFNEAFLTSSSRGVVPIISIDNKPVGQGRVGKWTSRLSKAYQAYVEKRSEKIIK